MAQAPFSALGTSGGWTGTEMIVVAPAPRRRAAAYEPTTDSWRTVARPPRPIEAKSSAYWTGTELLFAEPGRDGAEGLAAYDPTTDSWRLTSSSPLGEIGPAVWAGEALVAASGSGLELATYDPPADSWAELPPVPGSAALSDGESARVVSLEWTGADVLALIETAGGPTDDVRRSSPGLAFTRLDPVDGGWSRPSVGPLSGTSSLPVWTGDSFVFLASPGTGSIDGGLPRDARFDPSTEIWTELRNPCAFDATGATWTGSLIISPPQGLAYDPARERCRTLPMAPWPVRRQAVVTWTGEELLEWSGRTSRGAAPRRDGIAYRPVPMEGTLGAVVDEPARPVRIRIPSLGIDLPVIRFGRSVRGASPGYPACDVALYWPVFDLPGAPGTTWVLAHAQEGMFLPLLEAARGDGPDGLIGRLVELQLRDGRLFSYRIYRVKPRADNYDLRLATQGRHEWEQRLVLQTSTGIGSAPKLQVAARLVDVGTTDEPRPVPKPRACG